VDSELGRGSTFRVILPPAGVATPRLPSLIPAAPSAMRQLRILVIDDDPAICRALCRLLGRDEKTTAVETSREALELIENGARFDVIFCDVMMPGLSGDEFFAILEERWPDQAARVVFMTGGVLSGGGRAFLETHPGRLIEKPFELAQIRNAIDRRLAEVGYEPSGDEPSSPTNAPEHPLPPIR